MMTEMRDDGRWRERPTILAGVGLVAALAIDRLLHLDFLSGASAPALSPQRVALAALVSTGAIAFVFTAERVRLAWAAIFAAVVAVIAGSVIWWNGGPGVEGLWDWRSASLFLAIAIAAPLFQTARDEGAPRFPYADVHAHAWTNVVLWFLGWSFAGIVMLLAWLLASLFDLIGIRFLSNLLDKSWFIAALIGAAAAGGVGLLRERDGIVRTFQRVVTAVLSVLAPVLGVGLILFLLALPFTGLDALWAATKATTPILLTCVAGALVLANAVIGDGEEGEATNPALRWSAMALGVAILPLGVIAAIATGLRIDQYGMSPSRLWAVVFVVLACAYGVAYLAALVRGRWGWAQVLRRANLRLAFSFAAVALLLATPLVSFNALATRDQVARLASGRVTPERFDWSALAFDFGVPGKAAVARLRASANPQIARLAREVSVKNNRYDAKQIVEEARLRDTLSRRLSILPRRTPLPKALRDILPHYGACGSNATEACTVLYRPGASEAVVLPHACLLRLEADQHADRGRASFRGQDCQVGLLVAQGATWRIVPNDDRPKRTERQVTAIKAALAAGAIEVRSVSRRQVFVGGEPVGTAFE